MKDQDKDMKAESQKDGPDKDALEKILLREQLALWFPGESPAHIKGLVVMAIAARDDGAYISANMELGEGDPEAFGILLDKTRRRIMVLIREKEEGSGQAGVDRNRRVVSHWQRAGGKPGQNISSMFGNHGGGNA